MLGILSRRLFVLLGILLLVAVVSAGFVNELAIINGDAIVAAFVADFLRYSLVLLALLMIATSVAEDFEFRQFERDAAPFRGRCDCIGGVFCRQKPPDGAIRSDRCGQLDQRRYLAVEPRDLLADLRLQRRPLLVAQKVHECTSTRPLTAGRTPAQWTTRRRPAPRAS